MNVCEKIDAFEQHVLVRQLNIAEILGEHFVADEKGDELSESAFTIISIVFSYFEMIEQFSVGESSKGKSDKFFRRGFKRVFSDSEVAPEDVNRLYSMVRCGMYHTAMPYDRCGLTRELLPTAIENQNGVIVINPALLTERLIEHFRQFCSDLRSGKNCELQQNFEKMFDHLADRVTISTHATTLTTPNPCDELPPIRSNLHDNLSTSPPNAYFSSSSEPLTPDSNRSHRGDEVNDS